MNGGPVEATAASIPPFLDGNCRVMRLLVNYGLLRQGLPPLIIPTEEKTTYLRCLSAADAGDLTPFTSYLEGRALAALQAALQSIQQPIRSSDA